MEATDYYHSPHLISILIHQILRRLIHTVWIEVQESKKGEQSQLTLCSYYCISLTEKCKVLLNSEDFQTYNQNLHHMLALRPLGKDFVEPLVIAITHLVFSGVITRFAHLQTEFVRPILPLKHHILRSNQDYNFSNFEIMQQSQTGIDVISSILLCSSFNRCR